MIDKRLDLLNRWLMCVFDKQHYTINSASDDASFRRYFRIKHGNNSYIAMDAPPEKENSDNFVKIANLLRANKLHAPKIIKADLARGFLLLEDLGNTTFLQALNKNNHINLYKKAIDKIIKMQSIDVNSRDLPLYNEHLLKQEMQLLIDWYLPKNISQNHIQKLNQLFQMLSDNALNTLQVFVHRDYHSRNLMVVENELAIIDFQDAVIGPYTYDLCSLLKDAYFQLPINEVQVLLQYYYKQVNIGLEFSQFATQFELMGLQRHLKILGIFTRLSVRDSKHRYLQNIPLVKKYIAQIADKYTKFAILKKLL